MNTFKMSCLHRGQYLQRGRGFNSALRGVVPASHVFGVKTTAPHTANKQAPRERVTPPPKEGEEGEEEEESSSAKVTAAKKVVSASLATALDKGKVVHAEKKRVVKRKQEVPVVGVVERKPKKQKYNDLFEEDSA